MNSRAVGVGLILAIGLASRSALAASPREDGPGKNRPFASLEVGYRHILSARVDGEKVLDDSGNTLPLPTGFSTGFERDIAGPFSIMSLARVSYQYVDWSAARETSVTRFDATLGPGLHFETGAPNWVRFRLHVPMGPSWMTRKTWESRLLRHSMRPRMGLSVGGVAGLDVLWSTPGRLMNSVFGELAGHVRSTPYRLETSFISGTSNESLNQSYLAYDFYWYVASGYAMHF